MYVISPIKKIIIEPAFQKSSTPDIWRPNFVCYKENDQSSLDREGYKNKICSEKSTCHRCNILYSPTYKTGYIVQFYYLQKIIKKEIKMDKKKIQLELLHDWAIIKTLMPFH